MTNHGIVLGDLTFTRSTIAVSEPADLTLLGSGLVEIGWARRRYSNV